MENRLNNQVTQYVQTVVNETTSPRAVPQAAPKQHPSHQQQNNQLAQSGYNNQQGNKYNQGNGGGGKQKSKFNPNGGYNQQPQPQQYGVPLYYQQYGGVPFLPQQQAFHQYPAAGQFEWTNSFVQPVPQQSMWAPCQLCGGMDHHAASCFKHTNLVQRQNGIAPALPTSQPPPAPVSRQIQSVPQLFTANSESTSRSSTDAERCYEREYQRSHHGGGVNSVGVRRGGPQLIRCHPTVLPSQHW